jgi:predicted amidohydrolase YtcJ
MWVTLHRVTERGTGLTPDERLTREQALRLYTINNAFLNREEKDKGTLEVGKLADMILIDRDFLTCPLRDIPETRVVKTIVGGKVVYET